MPFEPNKLNSMTSKHPTPIKSNSPHFNTFNVLFLATIHTILYNPLLIALARPLYLASLVDPNSIIKVGATKIRLAFTEETVPDVVWTSLIRSRAVKKLAIAVIGAATVAAGMNEWESLSLRT